MDQWSRAWSFLQRVKQLCQVAGGVIPVLGYLSPGFCRHLHSCTHTHIETQTLNLKINLKKNPLNFPSCLKNPMSSIHDPIVLYTTSAGHIQFTRVKTDLTCRRWTRRSPLLLLKLSCLSSQRLPALHLWNVAVALWWSGELWQDMPCWHP